MSFSFADYALLSRRLDVGLDSNKYGQLAFWLNTNNLPFTLPTNPACGTAGALDVDTAFLRGQLQLLDGAVWDFYGVASASR